MIEGLIEYGGAIYWSLLLIFCIITSIFAERRTSLMAPSLWGTATLIYVFGFTTYHPEPFEFILGVLSYILFGLIFTTAKWANLVYRVRFFVQTVSPYVYNQYELRHMAHQAFEPMDAEDVMQLPPDPFEFRTRLMAWFFFWPAFTIFRCFAHGARWVSRKVWGFFHDVSKRLYER